VFLAQLKEPFAQGAEGAVEADLHRADAAVEQAGDLGVREVLEAVEDEHFAVIGREGGEGFAHQREVVGGLGAGAGVGAFVGDVRQILGGEALRQALAAAEVIGGDGAGEVVDPGGELALVAVGVAVR
jgi:hypothetical protein